MAQPTNYTYKPGFGLEDLARAAYDPIAEITPIVGDVRAMERSKEQASQILPNITQGNYVKAVEHGLASLGEGLTSLPVLGTATGLAKVAAGGLAKGAVLAGAKGLPAIGGIMTGFRGKYPDVPTDPAELTKYIDKIKKALGGNANEASQVAMNNLIKQNYGWFKDIAGDIKREIPDYNAHIHGGFENQAKAYWDYDTRLKLHELGVHVPKPSDRSPPMPLGEVLSHDELYNVYRDSGLSDKIMVQLDPKMDSNASWSPGGSKTGEIANNATIIVNPNKMRDVAKRTGISYNDALTSVVLHEVQHAVQFYENFSTGISPEYFKILLGPEYEGQLRNWLVDNKNSMSKEKQEYYNNLLDYIKQADSIYKVRDKQTMLELERMQRGGKPPFPGGEEERLVKDLSRTNYQLYFNTLGEQEARNVSERFLKSKKARWGSDIYKSLPVTGSYNNVIKPFTSIKQDATNTYSNPNLLFGADLK